MTAQAALRRDLRIATQHVAPIRKQFRRERDRLARAPNDDPIRDAEWALVLAGLWVDTGDQVYAKTVTTLDAEVAPGRTPTFPLFVAAAAAGLSATSRKRIAAVRARKLPNLSRQLRKLYQTNFVKKRAVRIALDQTLRQTATFEHAAAERVEKTTDNRVLKVWNNQGDDRVRDSHLSVLAVFLDELFQVGGAELRYPRDPAAIGRETYGCRCWADYQI